MTISNVVLDRDNRVVSFDIDRERLNVEVEWFDGYWTCVRPHTYIDQIIQALKYEPEHDYHKSKPDQDPTPDYYNKTYKGVKLDPYRVCKIYDMNGGPREHIVKKLLRGINKDDGISTELDLILVVEGQLKRWKEMIKEDAE